MTIHTTPISLNGNEIKSFRFESLSADPTTDNFEGRIYTNLSTAETRIYHNGAWENQAGANTVLNLGFYTNMAAFPGTGTADFMYVDKASSKIYFWDPAGSAYLEISEQSTVVVTTIFVNDIASLPTVGTVDIVYIAKAENTSQIWNATTSLYDRIDDETLPAADSVEIFTNFAAFPSTGDATVLYVANTEEASYIWNTTTTAYARVDEEPAAESAVLTYATFGAFPGVGANNKMYIDTGTESSWYWDTGSSSYKLTNQHDGGVEQYATFGGFPSTGIDNVLYVDQANPGDTWYWDVTTTAYLRANTAPREWDFTAATTWTVTHNLSSYPPVVCMNAAGERLLADVVYTNANVITVTHSVAIAGKVAIS